MKSEIAIHPFRALIAFVIVLALSICMTPASAFAAASGDTLYITGTDYYSYVADTAKKLNAERAKEKLGKVTVDAALTRQAMQYAAELSVSYDANKRPDGSSVMSVLPTCSSRIAANVGWTVAVVSNYSPSKVIKAWMSNKSTKKQLLKKNATRCGVGCFKQGNMTCWVLIVNKAAWSKDTTPKSNKKVRHAVKVKYSVCATKQSFNKGTAASKMKTLQVGKKFQMKYCVQTENNKASYVTLDPSSAKWNTSNKNVITVNKNGVVEAVGMGSATVTAKLPSGKSITHKWTVVADTGTQAAKFTSITVAKATYTGKAVKPKVTVKNGSTTLKNGTHYTVVYKQNKVIGSGQAIIKGKGKYAGITVARYFDIVPKSVSIKYAKRVAKGLMQLEWNKTSSSDATGYFVRVSPNASMAGAKIYNDPSITQTAGRLKVEKTGIKYYVQVAVFKEIGGKYYTSAWSAKKSATL